MCYNKKLIKIGEPEEIKHKWKIPDYIIKEWDKKTQAGIFVPCGQCYECRAERGRNWTYKIFLEGLNYKEKCFITLTYADDKNGKQQVEKKELQDFIKRLRKKINPTKIKYFGAGEYGEKNGRPHYHIIVLGYKPNDIKPIGRSKRGNMMYTSNEIKKIWGKGRITIQQFNVNEIPYTTLYLNNNNQIERKFNEKQVKLKKLMLMELQTKHGIMEKYWNSKTKRNDYIKIKKIKELTKKEYTTYKKEYREQINNIRMSVQPEFNLWSSGMGFDTYINKQYYKYDMIIDGFKYERPKEFLRKIIENKEAYNDEIIEATIYELLKRKEIAEQQFEEILERKKYDDNIEKNENKVKTVIMEDNKLKEVENFNKIKLKKREIKTNL